jgi:hypothetical protein
MSRDDDELRALLDTVGDADGPSGEALVRVRARVMTRVGVAAGAGAGATLAASSAVAKTGLFAGLTWKVGASVAVVVASVTASGAWYARRGASEGPDRSAAADVGRAREPGETREGPKPAPSGAPSAGALTEPPREPDAEPGAKPRAASPGPEASVVARAPRAGDAPGDRLGDEVKLLDKAQSALQTGKARDAISALDEHASGHEGGALAEERAAARVFALCRLGRVDDARALTAQFLATWPRSPHVSTLKASCGGAPPAAP